MPNLAARWHARVEADLGSPRPVVERVRTGLTYDLGGRQRRLLRAVGPVHTRDGQEIDTDWETDSGEWLGRGKRLDFDTRIGAAGRRRLVPRPDHPDEWVEAARPQWLDGAWVNVPFTTATHVGETWTLVGAGYRAAVVIHPDGVRVVWTLDSPAVLRPIRWRLTLSGLAYDPATRTFTAASDGAPVLQLAPPRWWDSGSIPDMARRGGEIPATWDGTYLTLTPDVPADAVYPVTLDPDFTADIAAATDDGYRATAPSFNPYADYVAVGRGSGSYWWSTYLRFQSVTIYPDSDVSDAHIHLWEKYDVSVSSGSILSNIYLIEEENHPAPTSNSDWVTDHGLHTSAYAAWDFSWTNVDGQERVSSNFASAADELFANDIWGYNDPMGVHIDDDGTVTETVLCLFYAYDAVIYSRYPDLDITYTLPEQDLTLGLLSAATLLAPEVRLEQPVTLPLLSPTTVYQVTLEGGFLLPLLAATSLLGPVVTTVQILTLTAPVSPVGVPGPVVVDTLQTLTLEGPVSPVVVGTPSVHLNVSFDAVSPVSVPVGGDVWERPPGLNVRTLDDEEVPVLSGTLQIDTAIGERSTARFLVDDPDDDLDLAPGSTFLIYDGDELVFGGFVDTSRLVPTLPGAGRRYDITMKDWHYLADRRAVAAAYENTTAGAIVLDEIADLLTADGVTVTGATVQNGPAVFLAQFNYCTIARAMDVLCDYSRFNWWIGPDRVLYFADPDSWVAPWELTWDDIDDQRPVQTLGNQQYRNRQFLIGARGTTDPQEETFLGDGATRTFTVAFPIISVPDIVVDYEEQTVGIGGLDTGYQWYWNGESQQVYSDLDAAPPAAGAAITVTYEGSYPIVALGRDMGQIGLRADLEGFGTGMVDAVDESPSIRTQAEAYEIVSGKLARYAVEGQTLTFVTRRHGLQAGMLLTVTLPQFDLYAAEMTITRITVSDEMAGFAARYDVTAVVGPDVGSATRYFEHLEQRSSLGIIRENLQEDEVVILLEQFSEGTAWAEAYSDATFECPIPSVNLYPSEELYPC